jgi:hypothetical protein
LYQRRQDQAAFVFVWSAKPNARTALTLAVNFDAAQGLLGL